MKMNPVLNLNPAQPCPYFCINCGNTFIVYLEKIACNFSNYIDRLSFQKAFQEMTYGKFLKNLKHDDIVDANQHRINELIYRLTNANWLFGLIEGIHRYIEKPIFQFLVDVPCLNIRISMGPIFTKNTKIP